LQCCVRFDKILSLRQLNLKSAKPVVLAVIFLTALSSFFPVRADVPHSLGDIPNHERSVSTSPLFPSPSPFLLQSNPGTVETGLEGSEGISSQQQRTILELTTIFENGTTEFQYSYIEDIGDGAGVTCGIVGFTGTELLLLTQEYVELKHSVTGFEKYLPCLTKMGDDIQKDYSCLFPSVSKEELATEAFKREGETISKVDFGKLWVEAGHDPLMQKVQMKQLMVANYYPALAEAKKLHIGSALGLAIVYDAIVQMPLNSTEDMASVARSNFARLHGGSEYPSSEGQEKEWLSFYQKERKRLIENNPRVDSLDQILESGNFDLNLPFQVTYVGEEFTLREHH